MLFASKRVQRSAAGSSAMQPCCTLHPLACLADTRGSALPEFFVTAFSWFQTLAWCPISKRWEGGVLVSLETRVCADMPCATVQAAIAACSTVAQPSYEAGDV